MTQHVSKADEPPFKGVELHWECFFPAFALEEGLRSNLPIKWSQDLGTEYERPYTLILFTYKVELVTFKTRLFIADDKLEEFKSKLSDHERLPSGTTMKKFRVTDDFQYGQVNKEGKGRFLVYHDKNWKPYQHRFVTSPYDKFGSAGLKILAEAGYGSDNGWNLVKEAAKSTFGDELHDFGEKEWKGRNTGWDHAVKAASGTIDEVIDFFKD